MRRLTLGAFVALLLPAAAAAPAAASSPPVIDVAADPGTGLGEPQVHVNPLDPQDVVIGENNSGVSVSNDGGLTFTQRALANPGDNALAVGPDGRFGYTSLDGQVHLSTDRGNTWSTVGNWVGEVAAQTGLAASVPGGTVAVREAGCSSPDPAGPDSDLPSPDSPGLQAVGCDRPWLTADAQTGELYASFTDHDDASGGSLTVPWELSDLACRDTVLVNPVFQCGRQYVSSSTDGGRTWSRFLPMDTATYPAAGTGGFSGGPVAAHGVLATAYSATGPGCDYCIVFETSDQGGLHWDQHPTPATIVPATLSDLDASVLFQPYVAADPSRPGRYAVMVFNPPRTQLLAYVTCDSGASWQGPARLTAPDAQTLYLPWIAYGPTGVLGVFWRTGYADGDYAAWAAVSPRGDTAFAPPVQLSSAPSPGPAYQTAADDASSVSVGTRYLYAAWGDRRGGSLGIHFGRYNFAADSAVQQLANSSNDASGG
jgi:hypothetical protein